MNTSVNIMMSKQSKSTINMVVCVFLSNKLPSFKQDIYNVTKHYSFFHLNVLKMCVSTKILCRITVFDIDYNMKCFLSIKLILE